MKITKLLMFAAVGVVAGILLTQTEKGNELRKDLADRAGDWGKKLRKLRNDSEDYADDLLGDASSIAKKARRKADKELA